MLEQYTVRKVDTKLAKEFVKQHHYSHGIHNGPITYGMFDGETLVGVCAFATPASEAVCASLFGSEHNRKVTELHRLVLLDEIPHNAESWFVSRALKLLKQDRPQYVAVISFADGTQGHRGVIYQATNFGYYGTTGRHKFYLDDTGRLRHPRQNGVNITLAMAKEKGWEPVMRDAKHRYIILLPTSKSERKTWLRRLKLKSQPYPKL